MAFDRAGQQHDALTVVDVDEASESYGQVVGWADLPTQGDELHHFGWNACSSALMHAGHDMGPDGLQRRFLLLPGLRSSRVHVFDTQPDPRTPRLHKTIEAAELAAKAGYSRPHTLHCGPDGVFLTCLGGADGVEGPGGIALLDHDTFDVLRAWETDRGPQRLAYDAWWHLNQNTLISSEWGSPPMIEDGLVPELLLGGKYGHHLHFWDLETGRHTQSVDLGAEHQMVLELRPSARPGRDVGVRRGGHVDRRPVGVGVAVAPRGRGLEGRQGHHHPGRAGGSGRPAAGAAAVQCGPAAGHRHRPVRRRPDAVRLVLGHRRTKQYDVSDPAAPREVGSIQLGGIVRRAAHPAAPSERSPAARRWSRSAATGVASS